MTRAGLFIGVDRTEGLPELQDAGLGAARMHEWARSQGMHNKSQARFLCDGYGNKIDAQTVWEAVNKMVLMPGIEQLIVYYAGHGVHCHGKDFWLLSDALDDPNEAIHVPGSVENARNCGVPYVVFISDACPVSPQMLRKNPLYGTIAFPNMGIRVASSPVDCFFARPLELSPKEAMALKGNDAAFSTAYTTLLLEALQGRDEELLDRASDGAYYVNPVKLDNFLRREVPHRLQGLAGGRQIRPYAMLSKHSHWLSRVEHLYLAHEPEERPGVGQSGGPKPGASPRRGL